MATTALNNPLQNNKYGATELKEFIQKNTVRGFIYAMALIILLLLLYFVFNIITERANQLSVAPVKIKLTTLPPPPSQNAPPPIPPPATQAIASGPAARAGAPVPIPDAMISPDLKDFANVNEISRASTEGGSGEDFGGFDVGNHDGAVDVNVQNVQQEEEPDAYDFVAVEKEPYTDMKELQKKVVYPEIAKRAGIEGQVTLRVYIGKDGRPKRDKIIVEKSDNKMLDEAAIDAVMKTIFTPAIQNKQPVGVWLSLPIYFKLR